MARIELSQEIAAPAERCFDLARSVKAHLHSTARTGERVISGPPHELLELEDEITWEARHFGVRQRLTSRIAAYQRPSHFRDEMTRGAFRRFVHDHYFELTERGTVVRDVIEYQAPMGLVGRVAEVLFLTSYLHRFLTTRNTVLKEIAESECWREFVPEG